APTRVAADRAGAELAVRQAENPTDEPSITAKEWLAEHRVATRAEDVYRVIADETDLVDVHTERQAELAAMDLEPLPARVEPAAADTSPPQPVQADEDVVRVPTA